MENILFNLLIIVFGLSLVHLTFYAVTKMFIYIAINLFNIDWSNKFWVVYLFIVLLLRFPFSLFTTNKEKE